MKPTPTNRPPTKLATGGMSHPDDLVHSETTKRWLAMNRIEQLREWSKLSESDRRELDHQLTVDGHERLLHRMIEDEQITTSESPVYAAARAELRDEFAKIEKHLASDAHKLANGEK